MIVGWGSVGKRHARNLQELGYNNLLFLRSDRSDGRNQEQPHGVVVSTLEDALAYKPVAAVIGTPTALHLETAVPLAEHGCHLFIEKPLAADNDLETCRKLVAVARDRNIVTMIGCQFRFHTLLRELRDGLRDQLLGEVIAARAEWGEYLPDWHPWEDYRESYAARTDLGGGALLTLVHPIDYLCWLFGGVSEVQGRYRKVSSLDTSVPDDWADVAMHFRSGVVGHVHLDLVQKPPVHHLSVWGDCGRAHLDFQAGLLRWITPDEGVREVHTPENFTRNDLFMSEMTHFLKALATQRATDIPVDDGLATLQIVSQARRDAESHGTRNAEQ